MQINLKQFYLWIILFNIFVWLVTLSCFSFQISFCLMAYTLGLRHALDADHISFIDNLTRKLVEAKRNPKMVGFFFSLGHSTIVILLSCFVAILTPKLLNNFDVLKKLGGIIGGSFSIFFLFFVSILNIYLFYQVIRKLYLFKKNQTQALSNDQLLTMNPLINKLFSLINHDYQIFLIGILFGLGFDTATEIALLGISSIQAINGIHWWCILILPILFTSAMCLIDTTVNALSLITCRYAIMQENSKYFNSFITLFIAATGICIASCEFFHNSAIGMNRVSLLRTSNEFIINHFGESGIFITLILLLSLLAMMWSKKRVRV